MTDPATNAIIQQLLVDWDDLVDEDYNPIINALKLNDPNSQEATDFRNFYHKIDMQMNEVIKNKQQGFNDSIQMYSDLVSLYRKFDCLIDSMGDEVNRVNKLMQMDCKKLEEKSLFLEKQKESKQIAANIHDLHKKFQHFDSNLERKEFEFCTDTIVNIMNSNLDNFGAVQEMKHILHKKRKKLIKEMCRTLNKYVFTTDNIENIFDLGEEGQERVHYRQILRFIVQIDGLLEFDDHLYSNLKTSFFKQIHVILETKATLSKIFEEIINLFLTVIDKISKLKDHLNLKEEENFYGEKFTKFRIFCDNGENNCYKSLREELFRFVHEYTSGKNLNNLEFEISDLMDNLDYESLYENKYKIHDKMVRVDQNNSFYGNYKLIRKPSMRTIFIFNNVLLNEIAVIQQSIDSNEQEKDITDSFKEMQIESQDDQMNIYRTKKYYEKLSETHLKYLTDIQETMKKQIETEMNDKDKIIKKNIEHIFKKENALNLNVRDKRLTIFSNFLNILKPYKKRVVFLNNFFWAFEYSNSQFLHWFPAIFKSEMIKSSIQEGENFSSSQQAIQKFKKQILLKTVYSNDLSSKREDLEQKAHLVLGLGFLRLFYIDKLKEFEKTRTSIKGQAVLKKIRKVEEIFLTAFSLEIYMLLIHSIDKILQNSDESISSMYKTVHRIKNCLELNKTHENHKIKLPENKICLVEDLSSILNFYIIKSARNLKIKNLDELKNIIKEILKIEEILSSVDCGFNKGFDECLEFFESVIQNKCKTEDSKFLRMRIS